MAEAKLKIGQRAFRVACDDGQEGLLQNAAALLDQNAKSFMAADQDISEGQMLLMSGLMVADQYKAIEDENSKLKSQHRDLEARISKLEHAAKTVESKVREESKSELHQTKEALALAQKEQRDTEVKLQEAQENLKTLGVSNEKAKQLEADLEAARLTAAETDDLRSKLKTAEISVASLGALQTELKTANSKLEEFEKQSQELENAKQENENLRAELEKMQEVAEGSTVIRTDELQRIENENSDLKSQLEIFMIGTQPAKVYEDGEEATLELREELETIENQNRELIEELEKSNQELEILRSETLPPSEKKDEVEPNSGSTSSDSQDKNDDLMSDLIKGLEKIANS